VSNSEGGEKRHPLQIDEHCQPAGRDDGQPKINGLGPLNILPAVQDLSHHVVLQLSMVMFILVPTATRNHITTV
jgi:hypothetical protein